MENGQLSLIRTTTDDKFNLQIPFAPGTMDKEKEPQSELLPKGKVYIEFAWQMGNQETIAEWYIQSKRGDESPNVAVIKATNGKIQLDYYYPEPVTANRKTYATSGSVNLNSLNTVRVLMDVKEDGKAYIEGFWVNDTLVKGTSQQIMSFDGLRGFVSARSGSAATEGYHYYDIDYIKTWVPATEQAAQLAAADEAKITFDDIKGENESADNVTKDLALSAKTETENGLIVTGWESSNPDVVSTEGKVTRPGAGEPDAEVTLTPLLGVLDFADEVDGDYATADGQPITITVPTTDTGGGCCRG